MSIVAPAISAFGPLHRRQAPPPGRQRTTRRQSRSLSGPLRAFRPPGVTPGYPPEIRKVPVSAGSWCRWPHAIRHACTRTLHPHLEHQSDAGAPAATWPPLPAHHGVAYTDPSTVDSSFLSQGRVPGTPETSPPGRLRPEGRYRTEDPSEHTLGLIQKSHPAILAVTGSDHSPGGFLFRNGWLFSPEYALGVAQGLSRALR